MPSGSPAGATVVARRRAAGRRFRRRAGGRADAGQAPDEQVARQGTPPPRRLAGHGDRHHGRPAPVVGGRVPGRRSRRPAACPERPGHPVAARRGRWSRPRRYRRSRDPSGPRRARRARPPEVTYGLRGRVLRPGAPPERVRWAHDDLPETAAFAATDEDGDGRRHRRRVPRAVSVAARLARAPGGCAAWPPTRLAARPGIGTAVLDAVIDHVAGAGGSLVWCNARVPARRFYERAGFEAHGDEWDDPEIGPHVAMWRPISPAARRRDRTDQRPVRRASPPERSSLPRSPNGSVSSRRALDGPRRARALRLRVDAARPRRRRDPRGRALRPPRRALPAAGVGHGRPRPRPRRAAAVAPPVHHRHVGLGDPRRAHRAGRDARAGGAPARRSRRPAGGPAR